LRCTATLFFTSGDPSVFDMRVDAMLDLWRRDVNEDVVIKKDWFNYKAQAQETGRRNAAKVPIRIVKPPPRRFY
jgi:hypothetical protein